MDIASVGLEKWIKENFSDNSCGEYLEVKND